MFDHMILPCTSNHVNKMFQVLAFVVIHKKGYSVCVWVPLDLVMDISNVWATFNMDHVLVFSKRGRWIVCSHLFASHDL